MSDPRQDTIVLTLDDAEAWSSFLRRMQDTDGTLLVVLSPQQGEDLAADPKLAAFLSACRSIGNRLFLACKADALVSAAKLRGVRCIVSEEDLRTHLPDIHELPEALRTFSPQLWRLQLTTHLQRLGLLSLPKMRVYGLTAVSVLLFVFVVFRLLPSSEIRVWPRKETVSQTTNIILALSGAQLETAHVRTMPLIPIVVTLQKQITFDQITKVFEGVAAKLSITVINNADEPYSFRKGTRLTNQAGMVFRLRDAVVVPARSEATVPAYSDDTDIFGQIIGDRGNVPADVRWDFIGLPVEERTFVYGVNRTSGTGGSTSYRTVLTKEDIQQGRERLERELLADANKAVEDERLLRNQRNPRQQLEVLRPQFNKLSITTYHDFAYPEELLGEAVLSVPLEEQITFTAFAYDAKAILSMLSDELQSHVREGKQLLLDSLMLNNLDIRVIGFDDAFQWIKLTADLAGTDRFILDPLTPNGALFAKRVRERVAGKTREEALRVIRNMPEVENINISLWPPWSRRLPEIPAHILIRSE